VSALVVANTTIRQDADGRYCLNDLHRAAGGEQRHRPAYWLENQQTKELAAEISNESKAGIPALAVVHGGAGRGTYVAKELVYAYAMWISPKFHLQVIRAYDAMVTGAAPVTGLDALTARMDGMERAVRALVDGLSGLIPRREPAAGLRVPAYVEDEGLFTVQEVAASVPMGPNVLFGLLRDDGIINRDATPTQDYRGRGLFVLRARWGYARLYVTPAGAAWLRERYRHLAVRPKSRRQIEAT
jgi:anti-repressor protein